MSDLPFKASNAVVAVTDFYATAIRDLQAQHQAQMQAAAVHAKAAARMLNEVQALAQSIESAGPGSVSPAVLIDRLHRIAEDFGAGVRNA